MPQNTFNPYARDSAERVKARLESLSHQDKAAATSSNASWMAEIGTKVNELLTQLVHLEQANDTDDYEKGNCPLCNSFHGCSYCRERKSE